jgi:AcrR family transcriptional regulator
VDDGGGHTAWSGVLTGMSHLDDLPVEERYIPRSGPMFSRGDGARAELATDEAIPILAEGGWGALTMRNVAKAANVTPQAIAARFPSVAAMRVAIAQRYGDRWVRERGYLARTRTASTRFAGGTPTLPEIVTAMLPHTWLEDTYDGIWLTIVEAGRWDVAIASTVADVQERERGVVRDLIDPSGRHDHEDLERDVDLVLSLVRGMRATHAPAREGRTAELAAVGLAALSRRA